MFFFKHKGAQEHPDPSQRRNPTIQRPIPEDLYIRKYFSIVKPIRCTNESYYFILKCHTTCFGRSFRPSSGVEDCTYRNRHLSNRYCCRV